MPVAGGSADSPDRQGFEGFEERQGVGGFLADPVGLVESEEVGAQAVEDGFDGPVGEEDGAGGGFIIGGRGDATGDGGGGAGVCEGKV